MNRPILAAVLTAVAIAVPCGAWYTASRASVRAERDRLVNVARLGAENVALGLAERVGGRLETLRSTESRRPLYHYSPYYHDPTSDCACASITPSPLLEGPLDPLIWTHFHVDAAGRLSLPSLPHDDGSSPLAGGRRLDERARFARLETALDQLSTCRDHAEPDAARFLDPSVLGPGNAPLALDPLSWQTIDVDDQPALAAVRHVMTEHGIAHQGFVVSTEGVEELLHGAFYPASFAPSTEDCLVAVDVALASAAWHVAVDAAGSLDRAREEGDVAARKLDRTFLAVTAAALLAGCAVVGLVWQTDRLSQARSRFAAAAAHELRTPLAGLRVYGEMLADGLGDPTKTKTYAQHIASEAERLGRVVSNVLGFAQLERGELAVQPVPGDLAASVERCVARLRPVMESQGMQVSVTAPGDLPSVLFDDDAVFHIVQNLLDNAEKHTRGADDRRVHVELAEAPGGVVIRVTDHGGGVPPGVRERMFEAFRRGAAEGHSHGSGLGLGLTLVSSLARAQGGGVDYAEAPGGGARFTVTFARG